MSKYVVGTVTLSPEKETDLVRFFESNALTWWHWLPNLWLVVGSTTKNVGLLRDEIRAVIGQDKEMLVMEVQVQGHQWAGAGYDRNGAKMGDWLDGVWTKS